jgi:hypothetical protein
VGSAVGAICLAVVRQPTDPAPQVAMSPSLPAETDPPHDALYYPPKITVFEYDSRGQLISMVEWPGHIQDRQERPRN